MGVRMVFGVLGIVATLCAVGCSPLPAGAACEATGEGFTRQDPCASVCIDWEIECPDGLHVVPGVCGGALCESHDTCGDGLCLQVDSIESRCFDADVCEP